MTLAQLLLTRLACDVPRRPAARENAVFLAGTAAVVAAMGAQVLQRRGRQADGEPLRERCGGRLPRAGENQRAHRAAPENTITEITDDDYRSVWRPCEALDEDSSACEPRHHPGRAGGNRALPRQVARTN